MDKKTYNLILCIGICIIILLGIIIVINLNKDTNYYNLNNKLLDTNNGISNDVKNNTKENEIDNNIKEENKESINNNEVKEEKIDKDVKKQEEKQVITYTNEDEVVITNLNSTIKSIEEAKDKDFASKGKATFINLVDFLFYDGTIKGVTFKELSDNGKQKVLELASTIDTKIEEKAPGYKDNITTKTTKAYNDASTLIKKGSNNLNEFLKNKLDEDDYNSIIDSKNELVVYTKNAVSFLKDVGSSLFTSTKEKLSKWYQEYKNK